MVACVSRFVLPPKLGVRWDRDRFVSLIQPLRLGPPRRRSPRRGPEESTQSSATFSGIARLNAGDGSFKFLPYQLSMVGSRPTMAFTGNGELGFDSGEGA